MYVRSVLSDYIGYLIGQDSTLNGSTQIVDPAKKSSNNGNTQIRKCFRFVTATLVVKALVDGIIMLPKELDQITLISG